MPLASTMPVRLSIEGVGEAAELTRTPLVCPGWCAMAAISDFQAINLKNEKKKNLVKMESHNGLRNE